MRRLLPILGFIVVACEPPPPVEPDPETLQPSIEILLPERNVGTLEAEDCEGNLNLLVVVDVENIELQSPYEEGVEIVEGEGHWHGFFQSDSSAYAASFSNTIELSLAGPFDFDGPPVIQSLQVALQDNLHNPLEGVGATSTIEFTLTQPARDLDGNDCQ